jgi:SAM-dependent methyltransferase
MSSVGPERRLKKLLAKPVKDGLNSSINALTRLQYKLYASQARALHAELHKEVRSISTEEMQRFENELQQYAAERKYEADYETEFLAQRFRIYLSLKWLEEALESYGNPEISTNLQALEMGGVTIVTDLLMKRFPQYGWQNTHFDIRYAWDIPSESVDVIVSMEVLEHLSDLPDGINNGFYSTGMKAALRESYRVLKPGGILFLTTPNGASAFNLLKSLAGAPAWFYPLHVREYTLEELHSALAETGLKVQRSQAVQCLTVDHQIDYTSVFQAMLQSPARINLEQRGDDLFVVAIK